MESRLRRWGRRRLAMFSIVGPLTLVAFGAFASAAFAGNFWATGHDQDYHCSPAGGDPNECAYFQITTTFVRNGSNLPVLILDRDNNTPTAPGSTGAADYPLEAVAALNLAYSNDTSTSPTSSSPPYVVEDPQGLQTTIINGTPPAGITTSSVWATTPLVDSHGSPLWSAIIVASDTNCGGCDLNNTDGTHLDSDAVNARTNGIQTFFNAGGGLLYLAGATDAYDADGVSGTDVYYASVPVPVGGQPVSAPFTVTPAGAGLGITDTMVNCCATHNSFTLPSSSSPVQVAETDSSGLAESLFLQSGAVCSGGFCSALTTAKTADSSTVAAGGQDGYTITITNPNSSVVTLTSITDTLATGFTYVAGSTTGVTTADPTISSGTATWSGSFSVPAGGSVTLHFNVTAPSTAGGPFTDDASGTASGGGVTPTGPTAPVTVTGTTPPSPLTTAKTADSSTVAAGGQDGYTITISNPNSAAVTLTSITDTLASGFTYVPGSTSGVTTADPSVSGGTATWSGSFSVPAKSSVTLHFNVTAPSTAGGPFTDDAGGTATGDTVTPSGPTAPVTVTGGGNVTSVTCNPGQSCQTNISTSVSDLTVLAKPGAAGTLTESVDTGSRLECPGYRSQDPNWYGFFETAANREKKLTYTLKNTTRDSSQFCFGAPYEFKTKGGGHARRHRLPDGTTGFVGLLPLCRVTHHGPCIGSRRQVPDATSTTGFDTVIQALIPAGPGDPWGRM
jgi:uncharacterized repeat protein (TIGR01451 family)